MSTIGFVYSKLANDTNISSVVGDRIYQGFAPADVPCPLIVLTHVYTNDVYYIPTSRAIRRDTVQIMLVDEGGSLETLRSLAPYVDSALTKQHQTTVDGTYVYAGWCTGQAESIFQEDGRPFATIRMDFRFDYE